MSGSTLLTSSSLAASTTAIPPKLQSPAPLLYLFLIGETRTAGSTATGPCSTSSGDSSGSTAIWHPSKKLLRFPVFVAVELSPQCMELVQKVKR